jgi:hypothetical protein
VVEEGPRLAGQDAEEQDEAQRPEDERRRAVEPGHRPGLGHASGEGVRGPEGEDHGQPGPELRVEDRGERGGVQRQVAHEEADDRQEHHGVAEGAGEGRALGHAEPQQEDTLDRPGEGDAEQAQLDGDREGEEHRGEAQGHAGAQGIPSLPARGEAEGEVHGGEAGRGRAEERRLARPQDPVEDRPGEARRHDVRERAGDPERTAGGEAIHGEEEDVEARHRDPEGESLPLPAGPVVAVVPGEHGESGQRRARRHRRGPAPRGHRGEERLRHEEREEGGGPVRARGEGDRRHAPGHDGEAGQAALREGSPRPGERHEERPAHHPGRGEAEALRAVVGGGPRGKGQDHRRDRHQGHRSPEGAGRPEAGEGETEGQEEQHLRPVRPDRELREAEGGEEERRRVPARLLLARRCEAEEDAKGQEPPRRDLEPLRPEVGRVPAGEQDEGAGEGEGRRLRPGTAAVEPERSGPEQQQVGEQAHRPVLAGREEQGGEVAAHPGEAGEQPRVEPLGDEHGARGHRDHERRGGGAGDEAVDGVGGEGGDVEAGEAGRGQALPEGPVLPPDDPQAEGDEAEAEHGPAQHAAGGAHPVVLPGVAHEEGEERHDGEPAGADEELRPEARGEVGAGDIRRRRPGVAGLSPRRCGGRGGSRIRAVGGDDVGRPGRRGSRRPSRRHGGGGRPGRQGRDRGHGRERRPGRGSGPRVGAGLEPLPQLAQLPQGLVRPHEGEDGHHRQGQGHAGHAQGEQADQRLHVRILPPR